MANWTLLSDYGRYKAGSFLSDEVGDPIASLIANGVPVVPTVAALMARAQQIKDTFGQSSRPEWQASVVFAQNTVVAEEGTVLNARPVLNFIGAGVTAVDDPTNNRINITVSAEAITGWTDGGTLVYPTTATDDVAMGVQVMEGTERLRVVNSVALVAALESTDPGGVGCTLSTHSRSATPADTDVIFRWMGYGEADAGAATKTEMFRVDVVADDVSDGTEDATGHVYAITAGALAESFRFSGMGLALPKIGTAAAAATQAASRRSRFTASMWTGAAEGERDWDIYAVPSSVAVDESGGARTWLAFDFEGNPFLQFACSGATSGNPIIRSAAPGGATAGIEFRTLGDFSNVQPAYRFTDAEGAGALLDVMGDGVSVFTRAADAALGYEIQLYQLSASPGQNDVIASFAGYGQSTGVVAKVKFGSLDFLIDDPATGAIDGAFRIRVLANSVETSLVEGKYDHATGALQLGFFGATPVPKQAAATPDVAELKAGLVALGLFNA